jgi:hypothetical protein
LLAIAYAGYPNRANGEGVTVVKISMISVELMTKDTAYDNMLVFVHINRFGDR